MNSPAQTVESLQHDFDRIAVLPEEKWNHNVYYHNFLLSHVPYRCQHALEIGCGTGGFSQRLAQRAENVLAVDLSSQMVRVGRANCTHYQNIEFVDSDILDYALPGNHFDCIATLTTLHHLPLAAVLKKIKEALKPGGVFLGLDLYRRSSAYDLAFDGMAYPISLVLRVIKTGRLRASLEMRRAYLDHDKTDRFLTLQEVGNICADVIPGALVRRHLFWRYSIVWTKPSE
jgi:SAM-dependent methyltransferase